MAEQSLSSPEWMGLDAQLSARRVGTPTSTEKLGLSATSQVSNTVWTAGDTVRFAADVDCYVAFGPDNTVVATTSSFPVYAKQPLFLKIKGLNVFIAAITATSGNVWLSKMEGA